MPPAKLPKPPRTNRIESFAHCAQCVEELHANNPHRISHRDYARFEIGWTPEGLQVWCTRHNRNVMDLHFHGQKVEVL